MNIKKLIKRFYKKEAEMQFLQILARFFGFQVSNGNPQLQPGHIIGTDNPLLHYISHFLGANF